MSQAKEPAVSLRRELGLMAVVATAVCTVIGGGINVLTVEIHEAVPGIGGLVPLAFVIGALPAAFCGLSYAILASAMPRAGGGYVYISRGLHPFLGFLATFSKWWGFSVACGVVAYMDVPLLRAAAQYAGLQWLAHSLEGPAVRLAVPLALVWLFWFVNFLGVKEYGWTASALMLLTFAGGAVLIAAGALANHEVFARAMLQRHGIRVWEVAQRYRPPADFGSLRVILKATTLLFFAYIGFDAASQAGGETKNPRVIVPRALVLALLIITGYYLLVSWALYHAAPWQYVAQLVLEREAQASVPELLGVLLPAGLAVFVAFVGATVLADDIPSILMAASRLFFAWANDGVFPRAWAAVHPRFHTPYPALIASALFASLGVVGCHFFGPVRMGVDAVVLALLFTYTCVALAVITLPRRNPALYAQILFVRTRWKQVVVASLSAACTGLMLLLQVRDGLLKLAEQVAQQVAQGQSWLPALGANLFSCPVFYWLTMLAVGAIIFAASARGAATAGVNLAAVFQSLPAEAED
jgi:APA family basic amino acid/polyamine antiporter